jgi:hypothetical protein
MGVQGRGDTPSPYSIQTGKRANPSLKVRTSVSPPLLNVKPGSPYTQEHAHPTQNDFTARTPPPYWNANVSPI